jgi:large subunit ribosomal protein L17
MANAKLGRPSKEKNAMLRGLVSDLLWFGKVETTVARAKSVRSKAEKLLTLAINSYEDVVTVSKTTVNAKGEKVAREVMNDGPKKLAARRKIMAKTYSVKEERKPGEKKADFLARIDNIKNPLLEKIFNVHAPKYDARAKDLGQKGGYTRILKVGIRKGDNAEMAIIELI